MDPAASAVEKVGGIKAMAELAEAGEHRVRCWMLPRDKSGNGTGGTIPLHRIPIILANAKRAGIEISSEDLLPNYSEAV